MAALSDMLTYLRKRNGYSQQELAEKLGMTRSAIGMYETGRREPDLETLEIFADFYNVDMNTLTGRKAQDAPANILPLPHTYKVPLIGAIACGHPILAVEDAEETVDVPDLVHADFALTCKGDSMINARIFDGDIVYIHSQPEVETGQIAAVRIEDEATLKRVYYTPGSDRITLRACNPLYPDMIYEGETLDHIQIIGKAVGFYSTIRDEQ